MLKEIGQWYFDWGWIITTILAFPLGMLAGRHKPYGMIWLVSGLLALGLLMISFKNYE